MDSATLAHAPAAALDPNLAATLTLLTTAINNLQGAARGSTAFANVSSTLEKTWDRTVSMVLYFLVALRLCANEDHWDIAGILTFGGKNLLMHYRSIIDADVGDLKPIVFDQTGIFLPLRMAQRGSKFLQHSKWLLPCNCPC